MTIPSILVTANWPPHWLLVCLVGLVLSRRSIYQTVKAR